jgi:hypothetical protein
MSKYSKPVIGSVIEVNHRPTFGTQEGFNPADATVTDLLDTQFVFEVDGQTGYRFYKDYGDSWRYKE